MKKQVRFIVPFVWGKRKKLLSFGRKGFLILTTHSIAIVEHSISEKLKEENVDGNWKSLAKDIGRSMGVDTEHKISPFIGDYTIEDFERDIENAINFEIKFDSIIRLEIDDYHWQANKLLVVYQDKNKERKCDFVKIKSIEEQNGLVSGVTGMMFDWETVKNTILSLKDRQ